MANDEPAPTKGRPAAPATGRRVVRQRGTRRSVVVTDKVADWTIRVGGLAVIVAVFGIMIFLAQVVVPLFTGGEAHDQTKGVLGASGELLAASTDEYHTVVARLLPDGRIELTHLKTGRRLATEGFDFGGKKVTGFGHATGWRHLAFGFEDGTIRFGRLDLRTETLTPDRLPAGLVRLDERDQTDGTAVYSEIPGHQFRKISIQTSLAEEQKISEAGQAIVAIDYHVGGTAERPISTFAAVDAGGIVKIGTVETRVNILTRKTRTEVHSATLPPLPRGLKTIAALTTEKGDHVYVADAGGVIYRFDTRDMAAPRLVQTVDLLPTGVELTAFEFLIGGQSLVVGGADGRVDVYFLLQRQDAQSGDGYTLVKAHTLAPHKAAVSAMSISQRGKLFVTADAAGEIWLRHPTSEQTALRLKMDPFAGGYRTVLLAPREDGILAIDRAGHSAFWEISVPHPETTFKSIFGKIWYEGYQAPTFTWQSSSGTDSFEPKLSLVPLIFGTIKATFYALLFAIPIALLAAIFTSEFVHPSVRATVKPAMEMMASLPSVVLGFIAALILAPIVETWIAAVLMAFVGLPMCLLLAAYLWQLLPQEWSLRLEGLPKFALMFVVIAAGMYLCLSAGPVFERLFFGGDVKAWANGDVGSGTGFLFLLLLPVAYVAVALLARSYLIERLESLERRFSDSRAGLFSLIRWAMFLIVACVLSYAVATALNAVGGDPRGGLVGTYVQRNTLVVGFAMAFAVIPVIYTIAEDAMNSVPEHLRAASLALGATPWQTAIRVIVPTAASGIFAAIMIGMGRAVGETMIVVMAAGNTPIMDWNIFNGLRALSANIAVELPEAVKDGTLYRTLFLAALVLFVMTFIVNTFAEIIRQRFRKRAFDL